ncbi:MAG: hypothetical protein R6X10_01315 [Desulfobacterales bacterium]
MITATIKHWGYFLCLIFLTFIIGCRIATHQIEPDEVIHYDENYDFSDKKAIVETLANSTLEKPPLVGNYDHPTIIIYGITNKTNEHVSTSGITDDIRQRIVASVKAFPLLPMNGYEI